jgi:hypothetical protein
MSYCGSPGTEGSTWTNKWENLRSLRHRLAFGTLLLVGVAFLAALARLVLWR